MKTVFVIIEDEEAKRKDAVGLTHREIYLLGLSCAESQKRKEAVKRMK